MNFFSYEIIVMQGKAEVFTVKRSTEPDTMREIVRRLQKGYPAPDYRIVVDIVDVQRTRVIGD